MQNSIYIGMLGKKLISQSRNYQNAQCVYPCIQMKLFQYYIQYSIFIVFCIIYIPDVLYIQFYTTFLYINTFLGCHRCEHFPGPDRHPVQGKYSF